MVYVIIGVLEFVVSTPRQLADAVALSECPRRREDKHNTPI